MSESSLTRASSIDSDATRVMPRGTTAPADADADTAIARIISNDLHDDKPSPANSDKTRIAIVDPETGVELTANSKEELECTVVLSGPSHAQTPFGTVSTAHVPRSNYRHPVDATAQWNPRANPFHHIGSWLRQHRFKTICLAICVLTASVVPAFSLQTNPDSEIKRKPVRSPIQSQPPAALPVQANKTNKDDAVKKCSLAEAITLLTDGEYEKARAAYRFLCKQYPENRSFALTLNILETQEKYQ